MTPEDMQTIAQMFASVLQQAGIGQYPPPMAQATPVDGGGGGGRGRPCLDTKAMRIRDFDGSQSSWETWIHSFKSAIRSSNPLVLAIMCEAEILTNDATGEHIEDYDGSRTKEDIAKMSGELYNIL